MKCGDDGRGDLGVREADLAVSMRQCEYAHVSGWGPFSAVPCSCYGCGVGFVGLHPVGTHEES